MILEINVLFIGGKIFIFFLKKKKKRKERNKDTCFDREYMDNSLGYGRD
jgi:hypothetical protein